MERRKGFTLIELLIVISIAAIIAGAIYSMFASSIDMMRRISRSAVTEDVNILFEKMDREIASQVTFQGIPFEGKETFVSFPSRIEEGNKEPISKGVGRISYLFNGPKKTLDRLSENLHQIYEEKKIEAVPLLEGVENVKFSYFVYNKPQQTFEWVDVWDSLENKGAIPVAVKVAFECVRGEARYVFKRTVAVPIAESTR